MFDMDVLADEISAIIGEEVAAAIAPFVAENINLVQRLAAMEARQSDEHVMKAMISEAIAALPQPQDGKSVTVADLEPVIEEAVTRAVAALPAPANGKDADLADIKGAVEAALAALPAPQDGRSVSVADVEPMIAAAVAHAVAALPAPINGKDADPAAIEVAVRDAVAALPTPKDGISVTIADVEPVINEAVTRAVAALPAPTNGKDADPAAIRAAVTAAVAALPAPKDGVSVTLADVEPVLEQLVARAISALPKPKDGIGVAGALIDRSGSLKMTLSDGTLTDLGRVEGKDGDPGLGFDDMEVVYDGERSFAIEFTRGDQVKSYTFALPMMIDRGVYRAGQAYQKGDCVTFGGSLWIAQADTEAKPDGADSGWRLGVKRGRDGKSVEGQ